MAKFAASAGVDNSKAQTLTESSSGRAKGAPHYGAADSNPLVAWRFAPHNHADQADIGRQRLRLFHPRGLSAASLCSFNVGDKS